MHVQSSEVSAPIFRNKRNLRLVLYINSYQLNKAISTNQRYSNYIIIYIIFSIEVEKMRQHKNETVIKYAET